jgi:hypothetical protein
MGWKGVRLALKLLHSWMLYDGLLIVRPSMCLAPTLRQTSLISVAYSSFLEKLTPTPVDTGSAHHLKTLTVKGRVTLKVGAPVILLKNLSDSLVNGLRGVVVAMPPEGPFIHFQGTPAAVQLKACTFSVFSPEMKATLAERQQIPLGLAFALTVHEVGIIHSIKIFYFKPNSLLGGGVGVSPLRKQVALTHFLPSILCTTYSYAQVKLEKNEWCHEKIINKMYTPFLILFGGNV